MASSDRKRAIVAVDGVAEDDREAKFSVTQEEAAEEVDAVVVLSFPDAPVFDLANAQIVPTEREKNKFESLSVESQAACVNAVCRLFLFKGTKHESISRKNVSDVLSSIDEAFKTHVTVAVGRAQETLYGTCGYSIVSADAVSKGTAVKKDAFYLVSALRIKALQEILVSHPSGEQAYSGFKTVVFFAIITTANNLISYEDLLRAVRRVDARFPETLLSKQQRAGAPIPELEADFAVLLERMQKEQYINMLKDEIDEGKKLVEFGPRFHAEVGKKKLLLAYYKLSDQPVDQSVIQALRREEGENGEDA